MRRTVAAVVGSKGDHPLWGAWQEKLAWAAGFMLASRFDCVVLTGGLGGAMTAALKGAREAGGITLGLLPGCEHSEANSYADIALPTGIGIMRNALTARMCNVMVAVLGGRGTTEEICFALDFKRPVFCLPGAPWLPGAAKIEEARDVEATIAELARLMDQSFFSLQR